MDEFKAFVDWLLAPPMLYDSEEELVFLSNAIDDIIYREYPEIFCHSYPPLINFPYINLSVHHHSSHVIHHHPSNTTNHHLPLEYTD